MQPRLDHVISCENLTVTDDGMKALVTLASGDMRKALNILQSTSMAHAEVNEDTVYTCTGMYHYNIKQHFDSYGTPKVCYL